MSFNLSWAAAAAGAVVIAGLLLALQRLRPAPRTIRLPAAPLWAQTMQSAPARVLDRRLRQWLAFLLVLAIALLLWGAFAQPGREEAGAGAVTTFYLDSSSAMASEAEQARAQLIADVSATPARLRKVVLGDGSGAVLLRPGEPVGLLARRLENVTAQGPSHAFDEWLKRTPDGRARYYGLPANLPATLPEHVTAGFLAEPVQDNRGIVTLAAGPAASGAWDRTDVVVRAIDAAGEPLPPRALFFVRDGRQIEPDALRRGPDGAIILSGLAADGSELTVSLSKRDGFAQDDKATITLPLRRATRVAIGNGTPALIAQTIARDPALVRSDADEADVVVNIAGADGKPSLRITPANTITFSGAGDATDLAASVDASGIAPWAARAATGLPAPTVSLEPAETRALTLPRSLLSANDDPAVQAAQPILVSRALLWLAGRGDGDARTNADVPGEATTRAVAQATAVKVAAVPGASKWPLWVWMLGVALILLMAEWWLFTRRRMP